MSRRTTRPSRPVRAAVGVIATAATVVALSIAGAGGASASTHVSYSGAVPGWATSSNDAGAAAADTSVEGQIYLPLRNQAGAVALANAVSTPGSPQYRRSISPAQWIATYSPTQATVDTVVTYLKTNGMTITAVPKSRQFVIFRGPASAVGSAFGTQLHRYEFHGHALVGPSSTPQLPTSVGGQVQGVTLDTGRTLTHPDLVSQDSTTSSSAPAATPTATLPIETKCSTYAGQYQATVPKAYGSTNADTYLCGYTPKQLRSAYGLDQLNRVGVNGSGQTVAILDAYASPTIVSDANTYSKANGEPLLTSKTYQQIVPSTSEFTDQAACEGPSGWQGEQTLDVESAHAIAPGAKILYVGATNCNGGLDVSLATVLDDKLATIVSNSYGNTGEAVSANYLQGEVNLELQAAAEGIGLYYSSGDSGDEVANLGYASPDFPASSPWVTAVGGTSLGIGKNGKKVYETGWGSTLDQIVPGAGGQATYSSPLPGSTFAGGAGGGVSAIFPAPAYQKGVVPTALSGGQRVDPDLSALADPYTGFAIGISPITDDTTLATDPYESETYGGTSLASPITAAMMTIVQQSTRSSIGFANPTAYALYKAAPKLFSDVLPTATPKALAYTSATSGNSYLITLDRDSSLKTTAGYDDVTGLGALSFSLASSIGHGRY
jgi:subtilase family serine protease